MFNLLYPYIKLALGTLYPAYRTWKALKRKDDTTRRRWMKYWVSFGGFQMFELVADYTLFYMVPFYNAFKLACIVWLVVGLWPKNIIDTIINRELTKREKSLDRWLNKSIKFRDEILAFIFYELSKVSIKIFTALMSGGFSAITITPQQSNHVSPCCSDNEAEEEESEQDTVLCIEQDHNENMVSMDWSAITLEKIDKAILEEEKIDKPQSKDVVTRNSQIPLRKSARREKLALLRSTESE